MEVVSLKTMQELDMRTTRVFATSKTGEAEHGDEK
jgi:hypothetical protein